VEEQDNPRRTWRISAALRRESLLDPRPVSDDDDKVEHALAPKPDQPAAEEITSTPKAEEPEPLTDQGQRSVEHVLGEQEHPAQSNDSIAFMPPKPASGVVSHAKSRSMRSTWIGLTILAIAVVVSCYWAVLKFGRQREAAEPQIAKVATAEVIVRLQPNGQDLILELQSAQHLQRVAAEVFDGGTVRHLDLTNAFAKQRSASISHTTGNVQVVVTAVDEQGRSLVKSVGFTDSDAVARDMASNESKSQAPPRGTETSATRSRRNKGHRHRSNR
jgi:hypothetical protein